MAAERHPHGRHRDGTVYVTPDQVHQMVTEGRESLVRIEGKIDAIDRVMAARLDAVEDDVEAVSERVTPLEHRVWAWPSLTGAVGAVALVLTIVQMVGGS